MPLVPVADHREEAVALLLEQFKGKPAIEALIKSLVTPANLIETTAFDMLRRRIAIDASEGVQLDLIGDMLRVPRAGLSDVDYRIRIRSQVKINESNGTGDELIEVSEGLVPNFRVYLLQRKNVIDAEFEAYAYRLPDGEIMPYEGGTAQMWSRSDQALVFRALNQARSAGVYFVLLSRNDENQGTGNSAFAFDGASGATFDVDYSFQIQSTGATPKTPE